jgi:cytochrome b561
MRKLIITIILVFTYNLMFAQDTPVDSLLLDLTSTMEQPSGNASFLPDRMLITQRMLWGQNGLYRKIGIAPKVLNEQNRTKELHVRRNMFRIHQAVGLTVAAAMLAQGFLGSRLYNDKKEYNPNVKKWHEGMATGINIGYATTALMSFTAPPPFINRKKFDNIKLHKLLSYVHLTGMITTNVLADKVNNSAANKKWHRAAAYTTFGAYAFAIASIKMEF